MKKLAKNYIPQTISRNCGKTVLQGLIAIAVAGQISCSSSGGDNPPAANYAELPVDICAPDQTIGAFTIDIDNQYFPLPLGRQLTLEGDDDGEFVRVIITVLDQIEDVAGVSTRVVEEAEYEDGELVEISRNFFVQAPDGTVCYYGEDVDDYENGVVVSHEGGWRAGIDGGLPGIIMPGTPVIETKFAQESAPGIAEDMSAIEEIGVSVSTPFADYNDALHAIDWNPLEGEDSSDAEDKYYAPGIGLVVDDVVRLVGFM